MKILILTPVYKRPEIVNIFLDGVNRLKREANKRGIKLQLLCIVSPEDRHRGEILDMIYEVGEACEYSNKFLGEKKNAGLDFALEEYEFDYMMELGSDDLVNPELLDIYKPYIDKRTPFFGLQHLYVCHWKTKECLFVENYNTGKTYGAGRMYRRDCIKDFLWFDDAQNSLDHIAYTRMKRMGFDELPIDTGRKPMILDLKCDTAINHFIHMKGEKVKYQDVFPYFGIPVYDEATTTLLTFEGFENMFLDYKKKYNVTYKKAYEETENYYVLKFGKRKYKNFESFKRLRQRKKKK